MNYKIPKSNFFLINDLYISISVSLSLPLPLFLFLGEEENHMHHFFFLYSVDGAYEEHKISFKHC